MTDLVERARISFWWPTSGHPVWQDATNHDAFGIRWTWAFQVPYHKTLVQRTYRYMRLLGAPPIAARWHCATECQRQMNTNLLATWEQADGTRVSTGPMAFFPPDPDLIDIDYDESVDTPDFGPDWED